MNNINLDQFQVSIEDMTPEEISDSFLRIKNICIDVLKAKAVVAYDEANRAGDFESLCRKNIDNILGNV
jgi:hypothetical protein